MKSRGYWTYERCEDIVSKYKTVKDLYTYDKSVYVKISKMKWINLLKNLEYSSNNILKRLIYVYEFHDRHCYVGLTYNISKRNKQHISDKNSSVYNYIINTGQYPNLIIKTSLIDVELAVLEEENILNFYIKNGWNVLNKSKTGSIGGFTTINIQKCIDEVKKYKKLSDFIKNSKKYYWYITKHNLHNDNIIIKELIDNIRVTNKPGKFKSKEECEKESLKYKTKTEFQLGSKTAWNYSRKNGWLYEFYPKKLN